MAAGQCSCKSHYPHPNHAPCALFVGWILLFLGLLWPNQEHWLRRWPGARAPSNWSFVSRLNIELMIDVSSNII